MSTDLSPMMRKCLAYIEQHGRVIHRYPGGFWTSEGAMGLASGSYFGTSTIEALVSRGKILYDEWKESHGRKFPIRASIT